MGVLIALLILTGLSIWVLIWDKRKTKLLDKIAETDPLAANRIATLNCKAPISKYKRVY